MGETVSVKTRAGDDRGARRVRGVVTAAGDAGFDLILDDGTTEHLAYDDVTQARTVFEWGDERSHEVDEREVQESQLPKRTGTAMNSDMMEALENIEREKGISIEIMLEALANALLTAYKRMPDAAEEALVEIDMETGAIKVIAQELDEDGNVTREWDDTPTDFGRIAAQTAKQVIFQRIREAEREMKYEEYAGREGDIVTGIIQQTDARYTLLDLGKVEALLPQAEQVQNEHYDHGSRLKAYIVEVRKTAKGPQIVVSRTHPGLVKRLFELEVPEIVDGVVELKAIAREPGHRTKLAVSSNDNNVDPVGACVGARGSRVRMVVNELRGEKVDIVPYSDDAVRVRDEGARAGARARGAHPPRHRHRRGHRPRLPAVARDRQGGPERPPRGAPHRLARRHQERVAARGRGGGRRRRVRRGRVGHQRQSVSSSGSRPRVATRSRPPRRGTRRRRPTPRRRPTRRGRRAGTAEARRSGGARSEAAPRPHGATPRSDRTRGDAGRAADAASRRRRRRCAPAATEEADG